MALYTKGDFGEAAAIHRETLSFALETLGWEHSDTLASANNLAPLGPDLRSRRGVPRMALRAGGRASEAEELFLEAIEVMQRLFGKAPLGGEGVEGLRMTPTRWPRHRTWAWPCWSRLGGLKRLGCWPGEVGGGYV